MFFTCPAMLRSQKAKGESDWCCYQPAAPAWDRAQSAGMTPLQQWISLYLYTTPPEDVTPWRDGHLYTEALNNIFPEWFCRVRSPVKFIPLNHIVELNKSLDILLSESSVAKSVVQLRESS